MRHITPTGYANRKGKPVKRLGSLDAVLEAMDYEGVVIFANASNALRLQAALNCADFQHRDKGPIRALCATAGPMALLELPPETVIGVDDDAFTGVRAEMWADMQRILTTRFSTVHWA